MSYSLLYDLLSDNQPPPPPPAIHIVEGCKMCKEERDVLEEQAKKMDDCDREKFSTPFDASERTIAILGDKMVARKDKTGR